MDLANILRAAIVASGKTQLQLAEETGVPQQRISAFMRGGDMKLFYAGKLADAVGLKISKGTIAKSRKRG